MVEKKQNMILEFSYKFMLSVLNIFKFKVSVMLRLTNIYDGFLMTKQDNTRQTQYFKFNYCNVGSDQWCDLYKRLPTTILKTFKYLS